MEEKKDETAVFQNNSVIQSVLIIAISVIRKGIFDLPLMVLFDSLFVVTSIIWIQPIMDFTAVVISLFVLRGFFKGKYRSSEANIKK